MKIFIGLFWGVNREERGFGIKHSDYSLDLDVGVSFSGIPLSTDKILTRFYFYFPILEISQDILTRKINKKYLICKKFLNMSWKYPLKIIITRTAFNRP